MAFADCRKIVKSGDELKIRWIDDTGLTISCDVYDPSMNKTTYSLTENPSGSGIYELSYKFGEDGDYLFVINGSGIQVSCISELSILWKVLDNSELTLSVINEVKSEINDSAPLVSEIKAKTDNMQFDNGLILAKIDDSKLAKLSVQKRQNTEIERLRTRVRVNDSKRMG